jgi:hypothetical protein
MPDRLSRTLMGVLLLLEDLSEIVSKPLLKQAHREVVFVRRKHRYRRPQIRAMWVSVGAFCPTRHRDYVFQNSHLDPTTLLRAC